VRQPASSEARRAAAGAGSADGHSTVSRTSAEFGEKHLRQDNDPAVTDTLCPFSDGHEFDKEGRGYVGKVNVRGGV
jgi:hypothetical protein